MAAHRGRHKKRAAAEAALDEPDPQDGHNEGPASVRMPGPSLITGVLQEWALGTVSAPRLQKLVHQAYNDQVSLLHSLGLSADHIHPDLKALAKLGNWGGGKPTTRRRGVVELVGGSVRTDYFCSKDSLEDLERVRR